MQLLTPDFVEFIECCARRDVRFLIVGGYALAAHGHPRATKDLDVWILIDVDNAERLVSALDDFGMGSLGLQAADFLEPNIVVQLGYPPIRIDLLTSVSGVAFEDCWARRINVGVGQVEAGFIAADDPIASKASSRPASRPRRRRRARSAPATNRVAVPGSITGRQAPSAQGLGVDTAGPKPAQLTIGSYEEGPSNAPTRARSTTTTTSGLTRGSTKLATQ